jgi:hypothetical protein
MPDITSAFLTIVVLLVICICASAKSVTSVNAFAVPKNTKEENAVCISLRNREYINATNSCTPASQRDMTMYHAAVAFAVPPPPVSSAAAKAAHAFSYRLNTQSIHFS